MIVCMIYKNLKKVLQKVQMFHYSEVACFSFNVSFHPNFQYFNDKVHLLDIDLFILIYLFDDLDFCDEIIRWPCHIILTLNSGMILYNIHHDIILTLNIKMIHYDLDLWW